MEKMMPLLLRSEDQIHWTEVLCEFWGEEIQLPAATAAEHLIAAAEVDYGPYRRAIRELRETHPLFEERLEIPQEDFEDFVAEALLLPSMLQEIDPVSFSMLGHSLERCLQKEDDGTAFFFLQAGADLLHALEEPLRAQVYLRNIMEIAFDSMERTTQQERHEKLVGTYPELERLCSIERPSDVANGEEVYAANSIFALRCLELALYFRQEKQRIARCDYCWGYFIPKTRKETHYCDRVTDGFPCKERGSRFKRNLDAERDEALLVCKRLRDRMYARLLRYMDASPAARQNLIPVGWEQCDAWSENARLARMDYLSGKLTAEGFLRKIDTMHDLESYAVTTPKEPPKQTIWQRLVAKSIGFDAERHYPKNFQMLDLTAANPTWQTISADELRARDQEGHRSLRDQYGKK